MFPFLSLPDDIIKVTVSSFVSLKALLRLDYCVRLSSQRRKWLEATEGAVLEGNLELRLSISGLLWLSKRRIHVHACSVFGALDISSLQSALPFLQSVTHFNLKRVTGVEPLAIIECLQSLQHIGIDGNDGVDDDWIVAAAQLHSSLKSWQLTQANHVTDRGLLGIAEHCTQLEALSLFHCRGFSSRSVAELCLNNPYLRRINFWMCGQLTDHAVHAIATHCKHLDSLDLSSCEKITDSAIVALAEGCTELTVLHLSRTALRDAGLIAIANHCPLISTLNIHTCEVSDAAIAYFFEKNHLVKNFICGGHKFARGVVETLAPHWTHMVSLQMDKCALDDAAVVAIAQHCAQLRTLWISKSTRVTDAALVAVARGTPLLEDLNLLNCERITDAGIVALSSGCRQLRDLKLGHACEITDVGLASLAVRSRNLRTLFMIRCPAVTDVGITALKTQCKRLVELEYVLCIGCSDKSNRFVFGTS